MLDRGPETVIFYIVMVTKVCIGLVYECGAA